MLSIALKVLSILGILLLCLLGLVVLLILLVLFFPVRYRLTGRKDAEEMSVSVRVSWLFGLLRVLFEYPEPGKLLVKVLPFTVFDSGKQSGSDKKSKKASDGSKEKPERESAAKKEHRESEIKEERRRNEAKKEHRESEIKEERRENETREEHRENEAKEDSRAEKKEANENEAAQREESQAAAGRDPNAAQEEKLEAQESSHVEADSTDPLILKKFKKIKYTICSIYDKIKNIWENISYYIELLREEETRMLFSHVVFRLGKILKSIRPRYIRGQILFGTGSPDTTGYAYGVYGMLSPFLGARLLVTPDFTRAVLEGDLDIVGHITVFTILWNGLKVLLDKKLRRFIQKMKAGRKK